MSVRLLFFFKISSQGAQRLEIKGLLCWLSVAGSFSAFSRSRLLNSSLWAGRGPGWLSARRPVMMWILCMVPWRTAPTWMEPPRLLLLGNLGPPAAPKMCEPSQACVIHPVIVYHAEALWSLKTKAEKRANTRWWMESNVNWVPWIRNLCIRHTNCPHLLEWLVAFAWNSLKSMEIILNSGPVSQSNSTVSMTMMIIMVFPEPPCVPYSTLNSSHKSSC